MSIKQISRLIKRGEYEEANYQTVVLPPVMKAVYQSRIAELTGYFAKSKQLAQEAWNNAKASEDKLAAAIAMAYANWRLFEFEEGHQILDAVSTEIDEINLELNPWRGSYFNIKGLLFWKEDKLKAAFDNFEKALVIREDIGENSEIAYTLNNLGNTYLKHKDYEKAENYYNQSLRIRELLQHKPALAASENSFGRLLDAIGNHQIAKTRHNECLWIWEKVGNTQFIAKSHRFLAINAYFLGEDTEVVNHFKESNKLFQELGNKIDMQTNSDLMRKYKVEFD